MDSDKDIENQQHLEQPDSAALSATPSEMDGIVETPAKDALDTDTGTPADSSQAEENVVVEEEEKPAVEDENEVEKTEEAAETDPMLATQNAEEAAFGEKGDAELKNNGIHMTGESERRETTPVPPIEVTSEKCTEPPSSCCLSYGTARKVLIGVSIGLGVAMSWVAATQFMKAMYSADNFEAPYFIIWFSTTWMLVCYPIYIIGSLVLFKDQRRAGFAGIKELYRDDQQIYGIGGMTVWNCLKLTGPFCALWMITNYMYAAALKFKQPTDVTAIFVTNTAFIYIFSWIWLEELLILLPARLFSVILSIVGTVLMMASDGFGGGSVIGVFLALGSAIGAALYKVLFKRFLGDATYGQVSLFLTMLAFLNLILLWPIMLGLYLSKREILDFSNLPWAFLCGTSALGIVFNFLVNFGIALTYPLLISLANILGIPINAVIDTAIGDMELGPLKIVGALLVIGGFLVMLIPEQWQARVACWKEDNPPCGCGAGSMERIPNVEMEEGTRVGDNAARV